MAKLKDISWKELNALSKKTAIFLESEPEKFIDEDVKPFQEEVMKKVEFLLYLLELEGDQVKKNAKNLFLIARINTEVEEMFKVYGVAVIASLLMRVQEALKINFTYYTKTLGPSKKLTEVKKQIQKEVNDRFGITEAGKVVDNGFISSILNSEEVKANLVQKLYTAIYSRAGFKGILNEAKAYLNGKKGVRGAIEYFYSRHTNNVFNEADRMATDNFRLKYDLRWFIYAGDLVANSRKFCIVKLGGVFSVEEAQNWLSENPHPLGIAPEIYNPIIHMGGVNCRHSPRFITEAMKIKYEKFQESQK